LWREWGIFEVHTELRQGNLRERDHLEDTGVDGWVILREILEKYDKRELSGLLIIIN